MPAIQAYAAREQGGTLKPFEYEPGPLGDEQVEVRVKTCGICHSDLSMLENDWHMTKYPFVPGHEVSGEVVATGKNARHVKVGDVVGVGWHSAYCMACNQCMHGDHNLCTTSESTIVGRHGGFADRVRCHWACAIPIPEGVNPSNAGPLFCGGITVFNPMVQFDVRPTDRVGVIGIGGLGHLALAFLNKWGCEVTAFTTSDAKRDEARRLGAHFVLNTRDEKALKDAAGHFDFVISTVNVALDWEAYIGTLAPKGRLHMVGAAEEIRTAVFPLLMAQRSISGTPVGSPATIRTMLEFAGRHGVEAVTEHFPMSKANEALQHLKDGKARYRIVLDADFR